jgi:hypothetical protein
MGVDGFDEMTVCFSCPKNLRDLLTNSTLQGKGNEKMSSIIAARLEEEEIKKKQKI